MAKYKLLEWYEAGRYFGRSYKNADADAQLAILKTRGVAVVNVDDEPVVLNPESLELSPPE